MAPRARRDLPQRRGQQPPAAAVLLTITLVAATVLGLASPAAAETIEQALARAYANNPQLNAQRAIVRQADEGKQTAWARPQAKRSRRQSGAVPRTPRMARLIKRESLSRRHGSV